jgi:hypothetical protein
MCTYYYYNLDAKTPESAHDYMQIIELIASEFPEADFNEEAAQENARKRLDAYTRLNAPQELLDTMSLDKKRVRCTLRDDLDADEHLEFDIVEGATGLMAYPNPNTTKESCLELVDRLAKLLGYTWERDEYD